MKIESLESLNLKSGITRIARSGLVDVSRPMVNPIVNVDAIPKIVPDTEEIPKKDGVITEGIADADDINKYNAEMMKEVQGYIKEALADIRDTHMYMKVLANTSQEIAEYLKEYNPEKVYAEMDEVAGGIIESFSNISSDDDNAVDVYQAALQQFVNDTAAAKNKLLNDVEKLVSISETSPKEETDTALETYNPDEFPATFELFSAVLKDDKRLAELIEFVNKQVDTYLDITRQLVAASVSNESLRKGLSRFGLKKGIVTVERHKKGIVDFLENTPMDIQPEVSLARYTEFNRFMDNIIVNIPHLVRWKDKYIKPEPTVPEVMNKPELESEPMPEIESNTPDQQKVELDATEKRIRRIDELEKRQAEIEMQLKELDIELPHS